MAGTLGTLWNSVGAFDHLMTETRNEAYMSRFTPEQLKYFYGFPAWVVAFWAIAVWGGVAGALLLLARRRVAVPVLLASLASMVITSIHNFPSPWGSGATPGPWRARGPSCSHAHGRRRGRAETRILIV